jgi:hypothetical protein
MSFCPQATASPSIMQERLQRRESLDDERKAVGKVIARTAIETHAGLLGLPERAVRPW